MPEPAATELADQAIRLLETATHRERRRVLDQDILDLLARQECVRVIFRAPVEVQTRVGPALLVDEIVVPGGALPWGETIIVRNGATIHSPFGGADEALRKQFLAAASAAASVAGR